MQSQTSGHVVLIDSFVVPEASKEVFLEKTHVAQNLLKTMPGFIEGYVYVKQEGASQYNVMTVAVWESAAAVADAKQSLAAEYQKIGFNPQAIMQDLHVELVRATYSRTPY